MKIPAVLLPETCNVLYYKFPSARRGLLLLATLAAAALAVGSEVPAEKAKATEKKDACCEEVTATAFTRNSLYQAEVSFTTDDGRAFKLGELRGRPVVLTMFFASCGYACPLLVSDIEAIRARLPAELRDRAAIVLVSFDTVRDTPPALATYRTQRGLDAQWTLLHGSKDSVSELAALLGVKYQQAPGGMFAHSNLITILNGEGEVVHTRNGLKGGLDEAAAALVALGK
jgi:protein SCO1/2